MDERVEAIAAAVVDCGLRVHKALGPGLLESVYEAVLSDGLAARGFVVVRQQPVPITFEGRTLPEGFRLDLLINDLVVVEVKSVERILGLHSKQLLTYLRLSSKPLGLLINFNVELFKQGVSRVANNYYRNTPFSPSSYFVSS